MGFRIIKKSNKVTKSPWNKTNKKSGGDEQKIANTP